MKKLLSIFLTVLLLLPFASYAVDDNTPFEVEAKSALLMDYNTGTVLYAKNADEALAPASVTKIMTLLLIMEAIDSGSLSFTDTVTASDYASGMGGSQIFLKLGEEMSVEDMVKSIVIASANDCAVAMAERIAGSETAFVTRMNERAAALGMKSTHFENVTGLDDDTVNHVTSAYDIALMSRELMKHEAVFKYSGTWMDTVRNGAFGLTNTNRLIRFMSGATGLKTGSTSKAGFCISATAKRGELHLIAVIMGSETRDKRNEAAKTLLEWGFSNYAVYTSPTVEIPVQTVVGGTKDTFSASTQGITVLLNRGKEKNVTYDVVLDESYSAPITAGDKIGEVVYKSDEDEIGRADITASESVDRIGFGGVFLKLLTRFLLK